MDRWREYWNEVYDKSDPRDVEIDLNLDEIEPIPAKSEVEQIMEGMAKGNAAVESTPTELYKE